MGSALTDSIRIYFFSLLLDSQCDATNSQSWDRAWELPYGFITARLQRLYERAWVGTYTILFPLPT
uniref:Uncharacterized protein n=1 Tax=Picea glauca TaxID=3330 RepID=A0A101LX50_PICGL|nr:hypothetical protein ABT39_MTgene6406 [Picea glauca]QHR86262.1 hypothetical protein Q903MT_gene261 [Picea sitchensis]